MDLPALEPATSLAPSPDWALLLDVDGTLLPIAETPDGVLRSTRLCGILSRLAPAIGGLSIHVGLAAATEARHRLADVEQVWLWLQTLADSLGAPREGPAPS